MRAELRASQLVGSYRIDELIGSGGMGDVYRAAHIILPRVAAIKVLQLEVVGTHSAAERMLQEARILAAIDHPNVVKVHDAGLLADGRPWVAMELLDGQTLADHLFVHGRLAPREAVQIVLAMVEALLHSHGAGAIHRDVKPENVILMAGPAGPQVKLIDWGIAHVVDSLPRVTEQNCSPGTPEYMSPEVLRGQPFDAGADIYALGVVAFEMLAGEVPFDGANPIDIAVKTLNDAVPPLPTELAVPPLIEGLIRAMLAKDPALRPSLEMVRAGFREWEEALDDGDYQEFALEIEIELDFGRAVSGEINC